MYFSTTLFTMLHGYMFQLSRGHLHGELVHIVSRVNKIGVQMYLEVKIYLLVCEMHCKI